MDLNTLAIAPSKAVERQRQQWLTFRRDSADHLDAEIADILDVLNALPGVATVFSCAGHDPDEDRLRSTRRDRFYIRMIVDETGLTQIASLYNTLLRLIREDRATQTIVGVNRKPNGEETVVGQRYDGGYAQVVYNKVVLDLATTRLTLTPQSLRFGEEETVLPGLMFGMDATDPVKRRLAHTFVRRALELMS